MLNKFKQLFYFPVASYFRFFAAIRLRRWKPKIIVVTGSNGKTTLLHMLEAQLGDKARYSHHANSAYGVPFDILGLQRKTLIKTEWIGLFLKTPFAAFTKPYAEKLYIVEADCDRPNEGKFLASFLRPEMALWVSTARTHSMNFDALVAEGRYESVEEAIAFEFGYFLEYCQKIAVIDGAEPLQMSQIKRTKALIKQINKGEVLEQYDLMEKGTEFVIDKKRYTFPYILPEESYIALAMCREAVMYFGHAFDDSFAEFQLPPGRGSLFQGIQKTILIDSCYNASPASMKAIVHSYEKYPGKVKWAVIGDMLELGKEEQGEHEQLAEVLAQLSVKRFILLGPRVKKYTYSRLKHALDDPTPVDVFESPKEVLGFILTNMQGEEVILFKGARFMEGIIENLLADKADAAKLSRREKIWQMRRKRWGF